MRKTIFFILFFVIIISLYTLLVPVKLQKENYYFINNYISMGKKTTKKINGYYFNQSECGYFSLNDGFKNIYYAAPDQFIESNIFGYILYNKVGDTISINSPDGVRLKEIKTFGYPYISGDFPFFYVVKTNGTGFFSYTFKGDEMFKEIDYTSLITSINSDVNGNTLVSNLDGNTYMYSPKGELLFNTETRSNDSKITMTKSNAIDETGEYVAICSGLNPEYVELYHVKNGKRFVQIKTETNYKFKSFLQFNKDRVYYEASEKLAFYEIKKGKYGSLGINGELNEVVFDTYGNIILISNDEDFHYLSVYNCLGYKKFYKEFRFEIDNLKVINDSDFYFKAYDRIIHVSFNKNIS